MMLSNESKSFDPWRIRSVNEFTFDTVPLQLPVQWWIQIKIESNNFTNLMLITLSIHVSLHFCYIYMASWQNQLQFNDKKKKKEGRLGNQNHTIFFFTLVDSRKCQIPSFREFFKEMDIWSVGLNFDQNVHQFITIFLSGVAFGCLLMCPSGFFFYGNYK